MFSFIKNLFNPSVVQTRKPIVAIGRFEAGTNFRVILPKEPLPQTYLMDLGRQLKEMGVVKRALYALFEQSEELSYIIMLDLEVPIGRESEAVQEIVLSIRTYGTVEYSGKRPLDFILWNEEWAGPVLKLAPQLQFFQRP